MEVKLEVKMEVKMDNTSSFVRFNSRLNSLL